MEAFQRERALPPEPGITHWDSRGVELTCPSRYNRLFCCNQSIPQLTSIYGTPRRQPGSRCPHRLFLRGMRSLLTPLCVFPLAPAPIRSILSIETRVSFPKIHKLDQVTDLLKMLGLAISLQMKPTSPSTRRTQILVRPPPDCASPLLLRPPPLRLPPVCLSLGPRRSVRGHWPYLGTGPGPSFRLNSYYRCRY